jgi:hypothetical protein
MAYTSTPFELIHRLSSSPALNMYYKMYYKSYYII